LGFTNLLNARDLKPELAEFVESIHRSGENLLIIVNDILDLSKIEAGMVRIESAPFSVRGLVHSIETMFKEKSKEKNLQFVTVVADTVPDILMGDATRLTQILMNLIGNAAKFTPGGSITVRIDSRSVQENTVQLRCTIQDTGIGIPKDKISGIFDRFQQAEDSITRKYGGTGLGLSIVKDLIQLQHGEISVESEPGKGTTFSFYIPYAISNSSPVSEFDGTSFTFTSTADMHILVVEDNEMNQSLLRHLLTGWRLSFEMVGNGIEAIEALGRSKYSLILMDIQMPGMDGYTATRQIRQELRLDLPIIAMTAHALAGEREKCLAHGMNEYISKPIQERQLYRIIVQFGGANAGPEAPARASDADDSPPINPGTGSTYQFINLDYMREISGGNTEYEKTVTGQFIDRIADDVQALSSAMAEHNSARLKSTAHNMKTSVSIMGLTEKLLTHLDVLEYSDEVGQELGNHVSAVAMICNNALQEARHFYSTL
jgi:CheY-like chemotaxis protein